MMKSEDGKYWKNRKLVLLITDELIFVYAKPKRIFWTIIRNNTVWIGKLLRFLAIRHTKSILLPVDRYIVLENEVLTCKSA